MRRSIPILLLLLAATGISQQSPAEVKPVPEPAEYTLYPQKGKTEYFHTFKGKTYYADLRITEACMRGFRRPHALVLKGGIDFKVFRNGVLYYHLSSQEATSQHPYQSFDFMGISYLEKGESAWELENLHFDPRAEMPFSNEGFVQVSYQNQIIEGQGIRLRLDLEQWEIDAVKGVLKLEE